VLAAAGHAWRPAFEASSLAAVQAAVQAGLGVAALLPGTVPPGTALAAADPGATPPGTRLPGAPSVELGLYRRAGLAGGPVLDRLEDLLWRALG
jgi:DNA-binding transcriptional LysR family regulator